VLRYQPDNIDVVRARRLCRGQDVLAVTIVRIPRVPNLLQRALNRSDSGSGSRALLQPYLDRVRTRQRDDVVVLNIRRLAEGAVVRQAETSGPFAGPRVVGLFLPPHIGD